MDNLELLLNFVRVSNFKTLDFSLELLCLHPGLNAGILPMPQRGFFRKASRD